MPVLLENNHDSNIWKQSFQSHLLTIVPASHEVSSASLSDEQLNQSHLEAILTVFFGKDRASVNLEQS